MIEISAALKPLIPEEKQSLEERARKLSELCENVREGLERMKDASRSDSASKKGVKAAQKAEKKYKVRLDELCSMDFSSLTEDEISDRYREVSTMITAIREANDLLRS